jgi:anti-anti-sigma factor
LLVSQKKKELRMTLQEDMSLDHVPKLRAEMLTVLNDATSSAVVLDMSQITVMDASGLKLLVGLLRTCQNKKLPLRIEVSKKSLLQSLYFCKLEKFMEISEVNPDE